MFTQFDFHLPFLRHPRGAAAGLPGRRQALLLAEAGPRLGRPAPWPQSAGRQLPNGPPGRAQRYMEIKTNNSNTKKYKKDTKIQNKQKKKTK